jgi:periplasmic copper chaperone A
VKPIPVTALCAFALGAACAKPALPVAAGSIGPIRISGGFAYSPITVESGAAYLTLQNTGNLADTLSGITSPVAGHAVVHGSMDGGSGSMARVAELPIPAGGTVVLKPGGTHLMLEGFDRLYGPGESIPITLTFRRAGAITLSLPVRAYTQ